MGTELDFAPAQGEDHQAPVPEVHFHDFRIDELVVRASLRRNGVSSKHVEELMSSEGHWPPMLVAHRSHVIIDGVHRFEAAQRLGMNSLVCECTTASPDEAYVEFIRRNVAHGLPLSLSEREAAARRILRLYPGRSDRWVGELCGLSHGTVSRLRQSRSSIRPIGELSQLDERVGRDGKSRPVDRHKTRQRIVEFMTSKPEASLRAIASLAGASPETVRKVREEIGRDYETTPDRRRTLATKSTDLLPIDMGSPQRTYSQPLVQMAGEPLGLFEWFAQTSVGPSSIGRVSQVPLSEIVEFAQDARRRAGFWLDFAQQLENQAPARQLECE